jgi:nucleoside-diphosphate-sugar epimerase
MATLLVIGGSGFFGKSILDAFGSGLLKPWQIDRVIAMARNPQKLSLECPELIKEGVELLEADITSCDAIPFADYVIHAAASTDVKNYIQQPDRERKNILAGTHHYCELAKKFHRKSKVVYASSGAYYGQQPSDLLKIEESYQPEDYDLMPEGKRDYAVAKREAELAIKNLGMDGLSVSIARCFAFVGRYLPRDQHFAIGNFIEDGLQGRKIEVKAQSPVYRSYLYADDLVLWLMTIAAAANDACPIYNVGSNEAYEMREIAEKVAKRLKTKVAAREIVTNKIDRYVPSNRKAGQELNLGVTTSLEVAIEKTIQGIRSAEKKA